MRAAARIAIPVIGPRAVVLWGLIRLAIAVAPLAAGVSLGAMPPSPLGVVLLCGIVGRIDIQVRGERILWANLGATPLGLSAIYAAAAIPGEFALALALR